MKMNNIPIIGTSLGEHLRAMGFQPASNPGHYMMNAMTGNKWADWYIVVHDVKKDLLTIVHMKRLHGQELRAELDILNISKVESKYIKPHVAQNMTVLSHSLQDTLWKKALGNEEDEPGKSN